MAIYSSVREVERGKIGLVDDPTAIVWIFGNCKYYYQTIKL